MALSTDLDGSEAVSDTGRGFDPDDQWLWRLTAELRLDPPILPEGLWIGADIGLALLDEVERFERGTRIEERSLDRAAPLLGLSLGWDFWLNEAITLTPELRLQLISLGEPGEFRPDVSGREYRSSTWLELALRLAVRP